jgi:hypothetical protein
MLNVDKVEEIPAEEIPKSRRSRMTNTRAAHLLIPGQTEFIEPQGEKGQHLNEFRGKVIDEATRLKPEE